jgi:hypothetical protein
VECVAERFSRVSGWKMPCLARVCMVWVFVGDGGRCTRTGGEAGSVGIGAASRMSGGPVGLEGGGP